MSDIRRIIILGFNNYQEIDRAIAEMMRETDTWLFAIVAGGVDTVQRVPSLGERWAKDHGAPVEYLFCENPEKLLDRMANTADYLIWRYNAEDNLGRRIMMKMKDLGKHGKVIK